MANRKYRYEDMQPVLERLLQDKESDELEFKTAAGGFPKSFWSTYSSFANTNGGAIVFGVKEKDEELILDGLDESQIAKLKRDFFNGMHSKQNITQLCPYLSVLLAFTVASADLFPSLGTTNFYFSPEGHLLISKHLVDFRRLLLRRAA